MINIDKLRGRMVEKRITIQAMAEEMSMNQATLYRRFNNPSEFTIGEVKKIKNILNLTTEDAMGIFFEE